MTKFELVKQKFFAICVYLQFLNSIFQTEMKS